VSKSGGVRRIAEHLGSTHDETEVAAMLEVGRQKIATRQGQGLLDLESLEPAPGCTDLVGATVAAKRSGLLLDVLHGAYARLGLGEAVGDDRAFEQMALARLIEPTAKAQAPMSWVIWAWKRSACGPCSAPWGAAWSGATARACLGLCSSTSPPGGLALCLYDVTTLYFETEKEDDLRKVGYSEERRVDPQIIVGLLVDRGGFPLQVGCWEGNRAETATIIPVVEAFQAAHGIEELVIVAYAGTLSASNLSALEEARLRFIVGARQVRAPGDLEVHFLWVGGAFTDGQLIVTITPRGAPGVSATSAGVMSRCGTQTPIRARGEQYGPTPSAARPVTTRPSQLRRTGPRPSSPARSRTKAKAFCPPPTPVTPPWMESSQAGPSPCWDSMGYVTNIPAHLMGAGERSSPRITNCGTSRRPSG